MIWLLLSVAWAARPTEGGPYAFSPDDDVRFTEDPDGRVRVHYSASGPNAIRAGDEDGSGVPDFAESVVEVALQALQLTLELGLRAPLHESEVGLPPLGGSDALDFYLVDFGGMGDGHFAFDACQGSRCAGYMVVENDFAGYGYPSVLGALSIVVPHELFHGVQAAYNAELPMWISEGTATWAVKQYDPQTRDFLYFADAYLADPGRPVDQPPAGPVPAFAYGTALWFDFLTRRHDPGLMHELFEEMEPSLEDASFTADLEAVLDARGDPLTDAWPDFASVNLATGSRSGQAEAHPYALRLDGVAAEQEGAFIDDENRFYPLAATYYRLDHAGGGLALSAGDGEGLVFRLHPVVDGRGDGPVLDAQDEVRDPSGVVDLGELPPGGYWLVGSLPERADQSTRVRVCFGAPEDVETCAPQEPVPTGCGCDGAGGGPGLPVALLALARRRRCRA